MIDRRAVLFSTVLCLCKATSNDKWKFKEKIWLRKFNVNDQIVINGKILQDIIRRKFSFLSLDLEHEHVFENTMRREKLHSSSSNRTRQKSMAVFTDVHTKQKVVMISSFSDLSQSLLVFFNGSCTIFASRKTLNKFC